MFCDRVDHLGDVRGGRPRRCVADDEGPVIGRRGDLVVGEMSAVRAVGQLALGLGVLQAEQGLHILQRQAVALSWWG